MTIPCVCQAKVHHRRIVTTQKQMFSICVDAEDQSLQPPATLQQGSVDYDVPLNLPSVTAEKKFHNTEPYRTEPGTAESVQPNGERCLAVVSS